MLALVLLTAVCILTYSFEIVFGLAGTIFLLTLLNWVYDAKTLVIYSTLPQVLVGTIGLLRSPRTVRLPVLAGMLGFAALGGVLGLYLFYRFPLPLFQSLLAATITLFGIYLVAAPGPLRLTPALALARALDTLAGASQALFGISGPVAMTRMLATFADKTTVRNYALAFFLGLNLFRAGGYLLHGTYTPAIVDMMLVSGPFLAIALWHSNHLHFRINESWFRRVVAWVILAGGVTLFLR
jgi:uncharacterized membrane protein YfcA